MARENLDVIRRLYALFGKGDILTVLTLMDEAIEWREAEHYIYADHNPYRGPQAILQGVFTRLGTEWEGYTVTPEEWFDAGDHIVVLGTYTGKYNGTGRQVRAQFTHVWGMRDGKIVRFQQYTDTKQFADVTGYA